MRTVDADVHPTPRNDEDLMEFLPEDFRRRGVPEQALERQGGNVGNVYITPDRTMRMDADPPDGQPAGSDPALLERQLFSEAEVDYAVLIPLTGRPTPNPEHEAAVCAATNEWLAATWLSKCNHHRRCRGSIQIASTDTNLAIKEVERWAGDHRFVQAMINPYSTVPLGHPDRHALYEVVAEAGLPLALHVIRSNWPRLQSPVGFRSNYLEFHPASASCIGRISPA